MKLPRRLAIGLVGALLAAGTATVTLPVGTATAAVQTGLGFNVTPAQPYLNNPDASDWIGSYLVGGKQVWCVLFDFAAPDSAEQFQPGQPLQTKWGTALDPTVAAEISYLLLRFGNTTSPDEAAALAHLLHSWTAAPQNPDQLSPSNDFRHIAYDANYHLSRLPASTQQAVARLQADAAANHGPWRATMGKPTGAQTIGTAAAWTVTVANPAGKGVANVPVTLTATDATLPGGQATATMTTPADGSPLVVQVTPTGPNPTLTASLASPNAMPVAMPAVNPNVQSVVTTGGQQQITTSASSTAHNAPGTVHVTKQDANTKAPITGASLRLTAADKASPATAVDGSKIVGTDGKPLVSSTAADGTVTVANLAAPQDVCVIETVAPAGYDQSFQANSPPTACGTVPVGGTLNLTLVNTPNKVPVAIPAGGGPAELTAMAAVRSTPDPLGLVGFGALLLLGAGVIAGLLLHRSARRR